MALSIYLLPVHLIFVYHILLLCLFRIAKDQRFQRLSCLHKGTYADDCIVQRVTQVGVTL